MFSEYFIDRPRFAGVVSIILMLLGLLAIAVLPISQYPNITPPQIIVKATYPEHHAAANHRQGHLPRCLGQSVGRYGCHSD